MHIPLAKTNQVLRFDDTNPAKEKEEFQDSIVEDLKMLGITPDQRTHTSDYFSELYDYAVQMIKEGKAYCDDTEQEEMRKERMESLASKRRDATPEENLKRFEEMKTGSDEGKKWCLRAKISYNDHNGALRDPVIYRCNALPHHRTGNQWKVYPTYDFCCPVCQCYASTALYYAYLFSDCGLDGGRDTCAPYHRI
jgi:glutamyl-tRNA synthetase